MILFREKGSIIIIIETKKFFVNSKFLIEKEKTGMGKHTTFNNRHVSVKNASWARDIRDELGLPSPRQRTTGFSLENKLVQEVSNKSRSNLFYLFIYIFYMYI